MEERELCTKIENLESQVKELTHLMTGLLKNQRLTSLQRAFSLSSGQQKVIFL